MEKSDFPIVYVKKEGTYRVIEDASLEQLLSAASWMRTLHLPLNGPKALAFTLLCFREMKGLSRVQLSKAAKVHRSQITGIEECTLKRGPQNETLEKLIGFFGDEFKKVLIEQGNFTPPDK